MAHNKGTLPKGTRVKVRDNTGLPSLVLHNWPIQKDAFHRSFFVPNRWEARISRKYLKGPVLSGSLVQLKKGFKRNDGCHVRANQNLVIRYNNRGVPGGSRIHASVPLESSSKIILLSQGIY